MPRYYPQFELPGGAVTETVERYHTVDLATGTSYTPSDSGVFFSGHEQPGTYALGIRVNTTGNYWDPVYTSDDVYDGRGVVIGDGSHLRYSNSDTSARRLVVMRFLLSCWSYERYWTGSLSAGSTYTPTDTGLFSVASSRSGTQFNSEFDYDGTNWEDASPHRRGGLFSGDGSHFRVRGISYTSRVAIHRAYLT